MTRSLVLASLALVAAGVVAPSSALAWDHIGWAIAPEDLPLRVTVETNPVVGEIDKALILADIEAALRRWDEPTCGFSASFGGEVAYDDPTDVPAGELHLSFAPLGETAPPFVRLGQTPELDDLYERDGRIYQRAVPGAWVVNTDLPLASDAAIFGGECVGERSLSSTVSVIVGVATGLSFSRDPEALMSGVLPACAIKPPAADDLEGFDALYGPWIEMACVSESGAQSGLEIPGVIPFDVICEARPDPASTLANLRWTFGDGGTGEGNPVRHTYTYDDNFPITLKGLATHPTCGEREVEIRRENYIRACDIPKPDFRPERQRGLRYTLLNTSDVRTWGCHSDVRWEVFGPDGGLVLESTVWEPTVDLPDDGVYRVELTLSGLAGSDTIEGEIDTKVGSVRGWSSGGGCSSAATTSMLGLLGWGGLGLAGLLLVSRRRRG